MNLTKMQTNKIKSCSLSSKKNNMQKNELILDAFLSVKYYL